MTKACHGTFERATLTAKLVVHCGDRAIEADADICEFQILELLRDLSIDERPVGGQHNMQPKTSGVRGKLKQVAPDQRLASRKKHGRNFEFREVIENRFALIR